MGLPYPPLRFWFRQNSHERVAGCVCGEGDEFRGDGRQVEDSLQDQDDEIIRRYVVIVNDDAKRRFVGLFLAGFFEQLFQDVGSGCLCTHHLEL